MQDSSTNPYIPQESEAIRAKVYERQSPLGRIVKWAMVATAVVAVLIGGGLFFVVPHTTAVDQQARQKLADALQPPDQTLKRVNVASSLGFNLNYDNRVYNSYAEVGDKHAGTDSSSALASGQTYENNDLRTTRAYNYVRISPIESVDTTRALRPEPPELEIFATVSNNDLVQAAKVPENKNLSSLSLFVQLDQSKREAEKVQDDNTVVSIDVTKPVSATIGDVSYQKVRYTTTNTNHRVTDVRYDDCYYTIQYNQPYSICVSNVRPTSVSAASLVEQVFDSLTFQQPQTSTSTTTTPAQSNNGKKTSFLFPLARLTEATVTTGGDSGSDNSDAVDSTDGDTDESPLLTVTPEYYGDANSLKAIAKAQPSIVRIGMLYCADLSLKFQDGSTATTLTDACAGSVSTGVFISKDGYIATTGHAIRSQKEALIGGYINFAPTQSEMLDRLQRVLDYLLKAKIILQSDADYLETGASIGDQEALAKVENIASIIPDNYIVPVNEQYTYAIQPSDQPIVINRSNTDKPSFAYSDSVLSAKYVASNYDAGKSIQEDFDSDTPPTDVGLLKADGSFPDVPIASTQTVKANDTLSTVGYPAYTDNSLTIDKNRNLPVVTTSKVNQVYKQNGDQLIEADTPVLPGDDGAPVVDGSGKIVGFAAYGFSYCPDQQCFANGTIRTIPALHKLLDDNNISLQTGSPAAKSWFAGVDQYFRANYTASANAFQTAGGLYSFNQWASPLQKLAATGEGTKLDTSLMNTLETIMIWVLVIAIVLTILLTIVFFLRRYRTRQMQVGHYGSNGDNTPSAPAGPVGPMTPPPTTTLPPVQPPAFQPAAPVFPQAPLQPTQAPPSSSPILPIHDPASTFTPAQPELPPVPPETPSATPLPEQPQQKTEPLSGPVEDPFYK